MGCEMALDEYGVLAGQVLDHRAEGGTDSPHFQILVQAGAERFRLAVNVMSQQSPSELLYLADETFSHPLVQAVPAMPDGFTALASQPGGVALDYIRGNLFDRTAMRALPPNVFGPDNDLADKLAHYVGRATGDSEARLYAFGQRWGPETIADKIFGFKPGAGVHDIHMNQGNSARFQTDDGVWQDGGLLIHYPDPDQWVAIFLAFQSQAWHTDDQTGHAVPGGPEAPDGDHTVRIVAALVNAIGPAPELETVTLLNASRENVDLAGWGLCDRVKRKMTLGSLILPAGETTRIQVQQPVHLGNDGGLITLLNPAGLKVDGVSYTGEQASREGWTIVF